MNHLICPHCGSDLIEDAWESTRETEDGGIELDAYPAYVCKNHCGYVERMDEGPKIIAQQGDDRLLILFPNQRGRILDVKDSIIWPPIHYQSILGRGYWDDYTGNHDLKLLLREARDSELGFADPPNLFAYATSELSQDAFLRWLFEHVRFKTKDIAFKVAKQLLELIFEKQRLLKPDFSMSDILDYSLVIEQQVHNIDVLLTFQSNDHTEKIYVIIEDKTNSGESRENQPEYYADILKVKDEKAAVIPVLLKTGYVSAKKQQQYKAREVVFIGYEDIYQLFSSYTQEITDNVILHSWWVNFCNKFYKPIESAKSFALVPTMTLQDINQKVKDQLFPEVVIFQKITDDLFNQMAEEFSTKLYSVQGKGHIDWHFELTKPEWVSQEKNIAVSLYFIWDTYDFSFVIKTSPFRYKPFKKLTNSEKKEYTEMQETIKAELKAMKQINWKMTNYYLQIAQMNDIQTMNLEQLKKKIKEDTILIVREIDRIMG